MGSSAAMLAQLNEDLKPREEESEVAETERLRTIWRKGAADLTEN